MDIFGSFPHMWPARDPVRVSESAFAEAAVRATWYPVRGVAPHRLWPRQNTPEAQFKP